ncbi:nucleoside hydrolase [Salinarimonas ramus]|uniref:Ribosylpyrimidine nucleosidase n=1 Tax=Salinarimonas ramus TaxID=690164 RepID=A0A917V6R1_9HYPH|nr:nucleoside hydrolase [Salinarimonas ramus]GGK44296.1 ribosylpyrimidine nucleosidase [Salinarimonas ramus]
MTRSIIIDTDPGQDDAIAILLALASPELEVLGVCAVAGNVPLPLTSVNIRKVLELAGRTDVPAFAGADRPLLRPLVTAEYVHGKTGLDGADLPEPTMPLDPRHAADFVVETVMSRPPKSVTLCPLAPLTNIALALAKEPRLAERLAGIVLMGGGVFEGGNRTPAAEFNIYVDPEAAARVFASGADVTFIPLDCTHQALTTAARTAAIRGLGTPLSRAVAGWLDFFERFDEAKYGTDGGPLHDPLVIAYLLRPDLFSGKRVHVAVETASELTRGMTVVDWWGVVDAAPNATMLRHVDADGFFALLTERLARL